MMSSFPSHLFLVVCAISLVCLSLPPPFVDAATAGPSTTVQGLSLLSSARSLWSFKECKHASCGSLPWSTPTPPTWSVYSSSISTVSLNGVTDFIDLTQPSVDGGSSSLAIDSTIGFTVSFWIYIDSLPRLDHTPVFSCSSSTATFTQNMFLLYIGPDRRMYFLSSPGGTPFALFDATTPFKMYRTLQNSWLHLGVRISAAGTVTFFMNGKIVATTTLPAPITAGTRDQCYIGRTGLSYSAIFTQRTWTPLKGSVHAFAAFSSALTDANLLLLAAPQSTSDVLAGTMQFLSGAGAGAGYTLRGVLTHIPNNLPDPAMVLANSFTTLEPYSRMPILQFMSTTHYVDILAQANPPPNTFGGSTSFSFCFHIQFTTSVAQATVVYLAGTSTTIKIMLSHSNTVITLYISSGLQLDIAAVNVYPMTWVPSYWNHFCVSYDATTSSAQAFWNAMSSGSVVAPIPADTFTTMRIGRDTAIPSSAPRFYLIGWVFYPDVALTPAQVYRLSQPRSNTYSTNLPPALPAGSKFNLVITPLSDAYGSIGRYLGVVVDNGGTTSQPSIGFPSSSLEPQSLSIQTPSDAATMTISFTVSSDVRSVAPMPICIELFQPSGAVAQGLTVLPLMDYYLAADFSHLPAGSYTPQGTGTGTSAYPSGVHGAGVMTFNANQQLNFFDVSANPSMAYVGIDDLRAWTISMWLLESTSTAPIFWTGSSTTDGIILEYSSAGVLQLSIYDNSGTLVCQTSTTGAPAPRLNRWVHVIAGATEGQCFAYQDGLLTNAGNIGSFTPTYLPSFSIPTYAMLNGNYQTASSATGSPACSYTGFTMWNRALMPYEMAFLAANKPPSLVPPTSDPPLISLTANIARSGLQLQAEAAFNLVTPPLSSSMTPLHATLSMGPSGLVDNSVINFRSTRSDYLDLNNPADSFGPAVQLTHSLKSSWTFASWLTVANVNINNAIFYLYDRTSQVNYIRIRLDSTLGIVAETMLDVSNPAAIASANVPQSQANFGNGFWIFVFVQFVPIGYSGKFRLTVGVDGITYSMTTLSVASTASLSVSARIGSSGDGLTPNFYGQMASCYFFQRALNKNEIYHVFRSVPTSVARDTPKPSAARAIEASADFNWVPAQAVSQTSWQFVQVDTSHPFNAGVVSLLNYAVDLNTQYNVDTGIATMFPRMLASPFVSVSAWFSPSSTVTGSSSCLFSTSESSFRNKIAIESLPDRMSYNWLIINCDSSAVCVTVCSLPFNLADAPSATSASQRFFFIAAVLDSSLMCRVYIDGQEVASSTSTGQTSNQAYTMPKAVGVSNYYADNTPVIRTVAILGGCQDRSSNPLPAGTRFAQFSFYQRPLSAQEIAAMYTNPPTSIRALLTASHGIMPFVLSPYVSVPAIPMYEFAIGSVSGVNWEPSTLATGLNIATLNPSFIDLSNAADNPQMNQGMALMNSPRSSITVSMWIEWLSVPTTFAAIFSCTGVNPNEYLYIVQTAAGEYTVGHSVPLFSSNDVNLITTSKQTTIVNQLHLLTVVWDASTFTTRVYVNGALQGFDGWNSGFMDAPPSLLRGKCYIAKSMTSPSTVPPASINLYSVKLWNHALTSTDVLNQYNARPANVNYAFRNYSPLDLLVRSSQASVAFDGPINPPTAATGGSISITTGAMYIPVSSALYHVDLHQQSTGEYPPPFSTRLLSNHLSGGISMAFWLQLTSSFVLPSSAMWRFFDCGAAIAAGVGGQMSFFIDRSMNSSTSGLTIRNIDSNSLTVCTIYFGINVQVSGAWQDVWQHLVVIVTSSNLFQVYLNGDLYTATSSSCTVDPTRINPAQETMMPIMTRDKCTLNTDEDQYASTNVKFAMVNYFPRVLSSFEVQTLASSTITVPSIGSVVPGLPSPHTFAATAYTTLMYQRARFRSGSTQGRVWYFQQMSNSLQFKASISSNNAGSIATITSPAFIDLGAADSDLPGTSSVAFSSLIQGIGTSIVIYARWNGFFNIDGSNVDGSILYDATDGGNNKRIVLAVKPSTRSMMLTCYTATGNIAATLTSPPNVVRESEWMMYTVVTRSDGTVASILLYINGANVAAGYPAASDVFSSTIATGYIGKPTDSTSLTSSLSVAAFALFETELTVDSIINLYYRPPESIIGEFGTRSDMLFKSASALWNCNTQPVSPTSGTVNWRAGANPNTGVCLFTGTSNPLNLNDVNHAGSDGKVMPSSLVYDYSSVKDSTLGVSFSVWFTIDSLPVWNSANFNLITCGTDSNYATNSFLLQLAAGPIQDTVLVQFVTNSSGSISTTATGVFPSVIGFSNLNQTMHLFVASTGFIPVMFINSVQVYPTTTSNAPKISPASRLYCKSGENMKGSIGRIAVWNRVLTDAERIFEQSLVPAGYTSPVLVDVASPKTLPVGTSSLVNFQANRPLSCSVASTTHTRSKLSLKYYASANRREQNCSDSVSYSSSSITCTVRGDLSSAATVPVKLLTHTKGQASYNDMLSTRSTQVSLAVTTTLRSPDTEYNFGVAPVALSSGVSWSTGVASVTAISSPNGINLINADWHPTSAFAAGTTLISNTGSFQRGFTIGGIIQMSRTRYGCRRVWSFSNSASTSQNFVALTFLTDSPRYSTYEAKILNAAGMACTATFQLSGVGAWTHLIMRYIHDTQSGYSYSSPTMQIFQNGALISNTTCAGSYASNIATTTAALGSSDSTCGSMLMKVSKFYLYRSAVSDVEIASLSDATPPAAATPAVAGWNVEAPVAISTLLAQSLIRITPVFLIRGKTTTLKLTAADGTYIYPSVLYFNSNDAQNVSIIVAITASTATVSSIALGETTVAPATICIPVHSPPVAANSPQSDTRIPPPASASIDVSATPSQQLFGYGQAVWTSGLTSVIDVSSQLSTIVNPFTDILLYGYSLNIWIFSSSDRDVNFQRGVIMHVANSNEVIMHFKEGRLYVDFIQSGVVSSTLSMDYMSVTPDLPQMITVTVSPFKAAKQTISLYLNGAIISSVTSASSFSFPSQSIQFGLGYHLNSSASYPAAFQGFIGAFSVFPQEINRYAVAQLTFYPTSPLAFMQYLSITIYTFSWAVPPQVNFALPTADGIYTPPPTDRYFLMATGSPVLGYASGSGNIVSSTSFIDLNSPTDVNGLFPSLGSPNNGRFYTVGFWVMLNSLNFISELTLWDCSVSGAGTSNIMFKVTPAGELVFRVYDANELVGEIVAPYVNGINTWSYVAFGMYPDMTGATGGYAQMWVNGQIAGATTRALFFRAVDRGTCYFFTDSDQLTAAPARIAQFGYYPDQTFSSGIMAMATMQPPGAIYSGPFGHSDAFSLLQNRCAATPNALPISTVTDLNAFATQSGCDITKLYDNDDMTSWRVAVGTNINTAVPLRITFTSTVTIGQVRFVNFGISPGDVTQVLIYKGSSTTTANRIGQFFTQYDFSANPISTFIPTHYQLPSPVSTNTITIVLRMSQTAGQTDGSVNVREISFYGAPCAEAMTFSFPLSAGTCDTMPTNLHLTPIGVDPSEYIEATNLALSGNLSIATFSPATIPLNVPMLISLTGADGYSNAEPYLPPFFTTIASTFIVGGTIENLAGQATAYWLWPTSISTIAGLWSAGPSGVANTGIISITSPGGTQSLDMMNPNHNRAVASPKNIVQSTSPISFTVVAWLMFHSLTDQTIATVFGHIIGSTIMELRLNGANLELRLMDTGGTSLTYCTAQATAPIRRAFTWVPITIGFDATSTITLTQYGANPNAYTAYCGKAYTSQGVVSKMGFGSIQWSSITPYQSPISVATVQFFSRRLLLNEIRLAGSSLPAAIYPIPFVVDNLPTVITRSPTGGSISLVIHPAYWIDSPVKLGVSCSIGCMISTPSLYFTNATSSGILTISLDPAVSALSVQVSFAIDASSPTDDGDNFIAPSPIVFLVANSNPAATARAQSLRQSMWSVDFRSSSIPGPPSNFPIVADVGMFNGGSTGLDLTSMDSRTTPIAPINFIDGFTLSMWMMIPAALPTTGPCIIDMNTANVVLNSGNVRLTGSSTNLYWTFGVGVPGSPDIKFATDNIGFVVNKWFHLVVVFSGTTTTVDFPAAESISIYMNGNRVIHRQLPFTASVFYAGQPLNQYALAKCATASMYGISPTINFASFDVLHEPLTAGDISALSLSIPLATGLSISSQSYSTGAISQLTTFSPFSPHTVRIAGVLKYRPSWLISSLYYTPGNLDYSGSAYGRSNSITYGNGAIDNMDIVIGTDIAFNELISFVLLLNGVYTSLTIPSTYQLPVTTAQLTASAFSSWTFNQVPANTARVQFQAGPSGISNTNVASLSAVLVPSVSVLDLTDASLNPGAIASQRVFPPFLTAPFSVYLNVQPQQINSLSWQRIFYLTNSATSPTRSFELISRAGALSLRMVNMLSLEVCSFDASSIGVQKNLWTGILVSLSVSGELSLSSDNLLATAPQSCSFTWQNSSTITAEIGSSVPLPSAGTPDVILMPLKVSSVYLWNAVFTNNSITGLMSFFTGSNTKYPGFVMEYPDYLNEFVDSFQLPISLTSFTVAGNSLTPVTLAIDCDDQCVASPSYLAWSVTTGALTPDNTQIVKIYPRDGVRRFTITFQVDDAINYVNPFPKCLNVLVSSADTIAEVSSVILPSAAFSLGFGASPSSSYLYTAGVKVIEVPADASKFINLMQASETHTTTVMPAVSLSSGFTVSTWISYGPPPSPFPVGFKQCLFDFSEGITDNIRLGFVGSNFAASFFDSAGSLLTQLIFPVDFTTATDEWRHVAISITSALHVSLYINGVLVSMQQSTHNSISLTKVRHHQVAGVCLVSSTTDVWKVRFASFSYFPTPLSSTTIMKIALSPTADVALTLRTPEASVVAASLSTSNVWSFTEAAGQNAAIASAPFPSLAPDSYAVIDASSSQSYELTIPNESGFVMPSTLSTDWSLLFWSYFAPCATTTPIVTIGKSNAYLGLQVTSAGVVQGFAYNPLSSSVDLTTFVAKLHSNRWYFFGITVAIATQQVDYYVNGDKVSASLQYSDFSSIRAHFGQGLSISPGSSLVRVAHARFSTTRPTQNDMLIFATHQPIPVHPITLIAIVSPISYSAGVATSVTVQSNSTSMFCSTSDVTVVRYTARNGTLLTVTPTALDASDGAFISFVIGSDVPTPPAVPALTYSLADVSQPLLSAVPAPGSSSGLMNVAFNCNVFAVATPISLSPPFSPRTYLYGVAGPFGCRNYVVTPTLDPLFASSPIITVSINGTVISTFAAPSTAITLPQLPFGTSTLVLSSPVLGSFTFDIYIQYPSIQSVFIEGTYAGLPTPITGTLPVSFNPVTTLVYTMNVGPMDTAVFTLVAFPFDMITPTVNAIVGTAQTNVNTITATLVAGTNTILLHSQFNSVAYTFTINVAKPFINSVAVAVTKAAGNNAISQALSPALALSTRTYSTSSPLACASMMITFAIVAGDSVAFMLNGASPKLITGSGTSVSYPLTIGINTITMVSVQQGSYTLFLTNPDYVLTGLSVQSIASSTVPLGPPLPLTLTPLYSPSIYSYSLLAVQSSTSITLNMNISSSKSLTLSTGGVAPQLINSGVAVLGTTSLTTGQNSVIFTTVDGIYTINVAATVLTTLDIDVVNIVLSGSLQSPSALTFAPIFSPSASFFYTTAATVTDRRQNYTLLVECTAPCAAWIAVNSLYFRPLSTGVNSIPFLPLNVGSNTIDILNAPQPTANYQNYSIMVIVPSTQPCMSTVCMNSGTCLNQVSTTYNTAFTCFCAGLFEGAFCEIPKQGAATPVVPPTAIARGPSTITDCITLELDGSQSTNLGPIGLNPFYSWSLSSVSLNGIEILNTTAPTYSLPAAVTAFASAFLDSLNSSTIFPSTSKLSISGLRMMNDAFYTFTLIVGNSMQISTPATIIVQKQPPSSVAWLPSVSIVAPPIVKRPMVTTCIASILKSLCQDIPADTTSAYSWTVSAISKVDANSALATISSLPTSAKSFSAGVRDFVIPANFFRVGYLYSVSLSLVMSSANGPHRRRLLAQTGSVDVSVTVGVTNSNIVASIVGSDRSKAVSEAFVISADTSYDPDYTGSNPGYAVAFAWTCTIAGTINACTLPPSVAMNIPVISIPAFSLNVGSVYSFAVTVSSTSDSRYSTTSVKISVTATPLVPHPIVTILNAPSRVNIQDTLRLMGTVLTNSNTSTLNMQYQWRVATSTPNVPLPSLFQQQNLGAAVNTSSLVLLPNLMQPGIYTFSLQVSDPFTMDPATGSAATTVASVTLAVNAKPQPGSCTASPSTGDALQTQFVATCAEWFEPPTADYEPFKYAYYYKNPSTQVDFQQLTPFTTNPSSTFLLPSGNLILRATIRDTIDSFDDFEFSVTVNAPAAATDDIVSYVRNITDTSLASLINGEDWAAAMALIQQLGILLNNANDQATTNPTIDVSSINALRNELVDSLVTVWGIAVNSTSVTSSTAAVSLGSQALLVLSDHAKDVGDNQLQEMNQLAQQMIDAGLQSSESPSSLTMANLGAITSNLLTSCSQLDVVSALAHDVLHLSQLHALAGESLMVNETSFVAYVQRTLVEAGSSITLPSGQSVILSAQAMTAYAATLNQMNLSTIDTSSASAAAEMDTRILTFSSQWSRCRGNDSLSDLTSIELTLPNGDHIDVGQLGNAIEIIIPLPKNSTRTVLENVKEMLCDQSSYNATTIANQYFTCSFWNTTTRSYSTEGCYSKGVTLNSNGTTDSLRCACNHLTEFAILYQQKLGELGGCVPPSTLGHWSYFAFLICYAVVGGVALTQVARIMYYIRSYTKYWLMSVEYTLIAAMCFFRSLNMAIFWTLYKDLSVSTESILSGLPYLFQSWIFTFVIVAWASIYYAGQKGHRSENPFKPYIPPFVVGNSVVSITLFCVYLSMAATNDVAKVESLNTSGTVITCVVEIAFSAFLMLYGTLLVRSLTKDFVSPYAKKLTFVAVGLSVAFLLSACTLVFSVAQKDSYESNLLEYNAAYFILDLIGLCIVMGLFAKSVNDSIAVAKNEKGTSASNAKGFRTRSSVGTKQSVAGSVASPSKVDVKPAGAAAAAAVIASPVVASHPTWAVANKYATNDALSDESNSGSESDSGSDSSSLSSSSDDEGVAQLTKKRVGETNASQDSLLPKEGSSSESTVVAAANAAATASSVPDASAVGDGATTQISDYTKSTAETDCASQKSSDSSPTISASQGTAALIPAVASVSTSFEPPTQPSVLASPTSVSSVMPMTSPVSTTFIHLRTKSIAKMESFVLPSPRAAFGEVNIGVKRLPSNNGSLPTSASVSTPSSPLAPIRTESAAAIAASTISPPQKPMPLVTPVGRIARQRSISGLRSSASASASASPCSPINMKKQSTSAESNTPAAVVIHTSALKQTGEPSIANSIPFPPPSTPIPSPSATTHFVSVSTLPLTGATFATQGQKSEFSVFSSINSDSSDSSEEDD